MRTGVRSRIADPVCPSGKSHQRAPVSTRGSPPRSRAATVLCKSRSPLRAHKAGPARPPPPPALPAPAPRPLSSSDTQTGLCPAPGPVARCGLCGSPQATARRCAFRGPALRPLLREAVPEKPACSGHGCPSTHFLLRSHGGSSWPPPPATPSGRPLRLCPQRPARRLAHGALKAYPASDEEIQPEDGETSEPLWPLVACETGRPATPPPRIYPKEVRAETQR